MKLSIDLEDTVADHKFDISVAETIRDEIRNAIRMAVKAEMKAFNATIKEQVSRIAKDAIAAVKKERVHEIAKRMAAEL